MRQERKSWGAATGGSTGIQKGSRDYYVHGEWNFICDTCGLKRKSSEMQRLSKWDGEFYVCRTCFELPNGQNFVRGIPDKQSVPWARPRQTPQQASGSVTAGQVKSGSHMTGAAMTGSITTG